MRPPELPDLPSLPSLPDVTKPIGIVVKGAEDLAGKVAKFTGLSEVPKDIEAAVQRITSFADEQIDSILNTATAGIRHTAEFIESTFHSVGLAIDRETRGVYERADEVVKDLDGVPAKVQEAMDEAGLLRERFSRRKLLLEKWSQRTHERAQRMPKVVRRRIHEAALQLELDFLQEAIDGERIGEKAFDDTRLAHEKTVADAKKFGSRLIKQTLKNRRRASELKKELKKGAHTAGEWVAGLATQIRTFKHERAGEAKRIRSVEQARSWVSTSIEGAHRMGIDIEHDVEKRSADAMSFGQRSIAEAMSLARSVQDELETAHAWAAEQKKTDALWRKQMKKARQTADDFLKSQGRRRVHRFIDYAVKLEGDIKAIGKEEIQDTATELGESVADVQKSVSEVRALAAEDRREIEIDFPEHTPQGEARAAEGGGDHQLDIQFPNQTEEIAASEGEAPAKPKLGKDQEKKPGPVRPPAEAPPKTPKPELKSKPKKPITADKAPKDEPAAGPPKPEVKAVEPKAAGAASAQKTTTRAGGEAKVAHTETPKQSHEPPISHHPGQAKPKEPEPTVKPDSKVGAGQPVAAIPLAKKTEEKKASASLRKESGTKEHTPKPGGAAGSPPKPPAKPDVAGEGRPAQRKPTLGAAAPSGQPVHPRVAAKKATPKDLHSIGPRQPGQPQKKAAEGPKQPEDPKQFRDKLIAASGAGEPPDPATRTQLRPHLGFDASVARIHSGPAAAAAARSVNADAFTIGRDVFFAEGKYDPATPKGLGLIAHEMTHVGQQLGLRGDKLRFMSPKGGDAMEQEAQEVGERVVSNLALSASLRIAKYVRVYQPADDEPITTGLQTRLDRLSMQALRKAARLLMMNAHPRAFRIDEVEADVSLDLQEMSDAEAIDVWAEAIVAAVRSAPQTLRTSFETSEALAPATHVLQRRLGDPNEKGAPLPQPPAPDPATLAKLAKVTASAQEKDMIRKLLVRKDLDPLEQASKRKQYNEENKDNDPELKVKATHSGEIFPDDKPALEAKLKEFEINSYDDYLKLKKDFTSAFNQKGVNVTNFILDENLRVVQAQKSRYQPNPEHKRDMDDLKESAKKLLPAMQRYIDLLTKHFYWIVHVDTRNLDSADEIIVGGIQSGRLGAPAKDIADQLQSARDNWVAVRREVGNKHVVLLGRNYDPHEITDVKDDNELDLKMFHYFADVESNIKYAKDRINLDKFWELSPMVSMTESQMGIHNDDGADRTVKEAEKGHSDDNAVWNAIQAGAAIALAVTAMVATGGLAAVALIGSAGLSVYGAASQAQEYAFKSAAANSSLDQAKLISKDDPSLFWLALNLVAAGLDVGTAIGAFKTLAALAKAAAAERATAAEAKAALKELEAAARNQYKTLGKMQMSEDQFVERLLEAAKKGVKGAQDAVRQVKLLTEMIEATTPRAAAMLRGDQAAIDGFVKEYGNWKGMMGSLQSGGEDAAKIGKHIADRRNAIIADLKSRGAAPLEDASSEAVSDFDLNVKGQDGQGAGERVLAFEKDMADKFGPHWSEDWLINFYTDKSQLLSVDQALKMVSPAKRAQIMKEVTEKAEKLNFAKMLEHAGDDEKAVAQVQEMMKAAGVKYNVDDLRAIAKEIHGRGRDTILREIDAKVAQLEKLPAGDAKRIQLAEDITKAQMEANFLSVEAYIGPAAVKGGPLTMAEAYQNAMSQLEMMQHAIGASGGDIVRACREYEFFKYVNRYVAAAKKAGVSNAKLDYFEGLSSYVYKRARSAHMETGGLPGVGPEDEAVSGAVSDQFLIDTYNDFRGAVNESLPKIKAASEKNPAGGWQPELKQPRPAAGEPPKGGGGGGGGGKPGDPPSGPPSSGPTTLKGGFEGTLPAAAKKSVDAAAKMAKTKGTVVPDTALDASKRLTSAGFSGSGQGAGVGVFKTTIPGVSHPVVVKMFPKGLESKMEEELAAALAAEKTGFGPKVHGKVTGKATAEAPERVGFAMDEVQGGFADSFAASDDAAKAAANQADMMKNAANITPQTFTDLHAFRDAIFEQGFYFRGELQGFVDASGRWKPIDMAGAEPLTSTTDLAKARELHDKTFEEMSDALMHNLLDAKKAAAKKTP